MRTAETPILIPQTPTQGQWGSGHSTAEGVEGLVPSFIKHREDLLTCQVLGKALQLPWRTRQFPGGVDNEELMTEVSGALGIGARGGEGRGGCWGSYSPAGI